MKKWTKKIDDMVEEDGDKENESPPRMRKGRTRRMALQPRKPELWINHHQSRQLKLHLDKRREQKRLNILLVTSGPSTENTATGSGSSKLGWGGFRSDSTWLWQLLWSSWLNDWWILIPLQIKLWYLQLIKSGEGGTNKRLWYNWRRYVWYWQTWGMCRLRKEERGTSGL